MIKQMQWRKHWQLGTLALLTAIAAILTLLKIHGIAATLLAVISGIYALITLYKNWQDFRHGIYRLHILPALTIAIALITRQFWFSLAVVVVSILSERLANDSLEYTRRGTAKRHTVLPTSVTVMRGRKLVPTTVQDLHIGDKIVWQAAMILPVDGQVVDGAQTQVNLSLLDGRDTSNTVLANTLLASGSQNVGQEVVVRVEQSAKDSHYQTVTRLLEKKIGDQTRFVRMSDAFSAYYALSAILIGAAAWYLGDHSGGRLLAVLAGATALPLLTSARIALSAAVSQAFRHGMIFRSGKGLQHIAEAKTMLLGFSGVLTTGEPRVVEVVANRPYTKIEVLGMAASLEQAVDHPLAQAIVAAAQSQGFNFARTKHVQYYKGQGVKANLQGREILVGNASLLTEHGITLPAKVSAKQQVVYVAAANELVGIITLEDQLQPSAVQVLNRLTRSGIRKLSILSGTPQSVVASSMGTIKDIDIHADASVAEKLQTITAATQHPVIFVGDNRSDTSLFTASDAGVLLGAQSLHTAHGVSLTTTQADIAYVGAAWAISQRAFTTAMVTIAVASILSLALMLVSLSGLVPAYLALGLQLVINGFAVVAPLRSSATVLE